MKILCRLDVWSAVNYFPALKCVKKEIDYYLKYHVTKEYDKIIKSLIHAGKDVDSPLYECTYYAGKASLKEIYFTQTLNNLWKHLCNVANIFEENDKEAFLPSYLSSLISY